MVILKPLCKGLPLWLVGGELETIHKALVAIGFAQNFSVVVDRTWPEVAHLSFGFARWWRIGVLDLLSGSRLDLPMLVHWSSGSVGWQQIGLARWWRIRDPYLFGGSRSDLPDCGALEFLIC